MRILVLDDNEILIREKSTFAEYDFTQVLDADDFWDLLKNDHWDEVWLDNDMGWNRPEGTKFALRILEEAMADQPYIYDVKRFRSISNNSYAGKRIADDLEKAGYEVIRSPIWLLEPLGVFRGKLFVKGEQ